LIILAIIIFAVVKGKSSRGGSSNSAMRDRRRVGRYDIYYDDEIFMMGAFWYDGLYFRNERDYYNQYGHHFTNRMYADSYNDYADKYENEVMDDLDDVDRMNDEILDDVDDRESYRNDAADADYEADKYENESRYDEEDANEYDDASDAFNDEPDFSDESNDDDDEDKW
jgi:hypothetical protein